MTSKRSISLPTPVDQWLTREASRRGLSVSAFIAHLLMKMMEEKPQ